MSSSSIATRAFISQASVCQFRSARSEEHTSELQSQSNLVCRLLLEKKKKKNKTQLNQKYIIHICIYIKWVNYKISRHIDHETTRIQTCALSASAAAVSSRAVEHSIH